MPSMILKTIKDRGTCTATSCSHYEALMNRESGCRNRRKFIRGMRTENASQTLIKRPDSRKLISRTVSNGNAQTFRPTIGTVRRMQRYGERILPTP